MSARGSINGPNDCSSAGSLTSDGANSDVETTEYGDQSAVESSNASLSKGVREVRSSLESPPQGVPSLALGSLFPIRSEAPRMEGAAEAEAAAESAAEQAHRRALLAERKLAASEWAALRTPRAPPQRSLDILDVVYDTGEEKFQEWVPSATFYRKYIRLLYTAANPLQSHPLKDFDAEDLPSDDEARAAPPGNGDSGNDNDNRIDGAGASPAPEGTIELPPVTPRTRTARFKALFKKQPKTTTSQDQSKGIGFFTKSRSSKRRAQEQMEAEVASEEAPELPIASLAHTAAAAAPDAVPRGINHAYRAAMEEMAHDTKVQQAELRRRLAADGNGAAADALRVEAAGFEDACDFKEESVDVVAERIYEVLLANGMDRVLPLSFAKVPLEVMAELEECLEEVVWGTQVFARRWGINVHDLLAHTPEWTQRNCSRWNCTETYFQIGRTLNLSTKQRAALQRARAFLEGSLDRLYIRRQQLNERVFELLQPPPPQSPDYPDELREALEELRENLAEEQRIVSQTEFICWKQVLNPCQGAWAVLKAMPEHCDILAMFNVISEIYA